MTINAAAEDADSAAAVTRRRILQAFTGITTAAVFGNASLAVAQSSDEESKVEHEALAGAVFEQFQKFIRLSAVLTGIRGNALALTSAGAKDASGQLATTAADPAQAFKLAYFELAFKDPMYSRLLNRFEAKALTVELRNDPMKLSRLAGELLSTKDIAPLARSIIMVWYFGVWYEWQVSNASTRFTVVSAQAYTQGWIWRIAQAHAPGWSNLRFGYWAFPPSPSFDPDSIRLKAV